MNLRRSRALLKKIEKHFKNYDQTVWHGKNRYDDRDPKQNSCNTQHCVAGFAQMSLHRVRGMKVSSELVARWPSACFEAREYLGLTSGEAEYLFSPRQSWENVKKTLQTGTFPGWVNELTA